MPRGYRSVGAALLAASALMAPDLAMAQTAREAALEERLARLEAEMQALRADLGQIQSMLDKALEMTAPSAAQ